MFKIIFLHQGTSMFTHFFFLTTCFAIVVKHYLLLKKFVVFDFTSILELFESTASRSLAHCLLFLRHSKNKFFLIKFRSVTICINMESMLIHKSNFFKFVIMRKLIMKTKDNFFVKCINRK